LRLFVSDYPACAGALMPFNRWVQSLDGFTRMFESVEQEVWFRRKEFLRRVMLEHEDRPLLVLEGVIFRVSVCRRFAILVCFFFRLFGRLLLTVSSVASAYCRLAGDDVGEPICEPTLGGIESAVWAVYTYTLGG
jgi:hypothetical protein